MSSSFAQEGPQTLYNHTDSELGDKVFKNCRQKLETAISYNPGQTG